MAWLAGTVIDGGCVFMTLSQEYRNRPGVIRDTVVQAFKDWHSTIVRVVGDAIDEGQLRRDMDPRQFAFEMTGIGMSFQSALKLMGRDDASVMARRAFARLACRRPAPLRVLLRLGAGAAVAFPPQRSR